MAGPNPKWNIKQLKAIEFLAGGGMTLTEIHKKVPVNHDTLWEWRKNPQFIEAILSRSREILREALPRVYKTLADRAARGDPRHIKALLDHMEHLERSGEQYRGGSITVLWGEKWEEEEPTDPSIGS